MITPIFIQVLFWIMVAASIVGGIIFIAESRRSEQIFVGLGVILFGPIFSRIYCELMYVVFGMHSALQDLRRHLVPQQQPQYYPTGGSYQPPQNQDPNAAADPYRAPHTYPAAPPPTYHHPAPPPPPNYHAAPPPPPPPPYPQG